MSAPITIRNLTAQVLTVKLVERYQAPNPKDFPPHGGLSVSNLTHDFGNLMHKAEGTNEASNDQAKSFTKQDVDLRLEPFTTHNTDIKTTDQKPDEILRLTFEGDEGQRWRIDAPTPSAVSQKLVSLTPDPKHDYTAIYFPKTSFLVLMESTDPQCWMKEFKDDTPLAALSLPGTHNSPTCHKALPSVRCQAVSPEEQLKNGVRFFDIRVQPTEPDDPKDETLHLVHGAFPISLTGPKKFRPLVDEVQAFLHANPSETVVMSLKREGTGNATDQQLGDILRGHYAGDVATWYTDPRMPNLGEARGKIVLLRRFALSDALKREWDGRGWGLDAQNWDDNTPNCTHGAVCVQDFYEVLETENIEKKIGYCCDHFERAAAVITPDPGAPNAASAQTPGPLYLNFLSASNFWKKDCWPEKIAEKLNPAVTAFLCEKHEIGDRGIDGPGQAFAGDGGVGIVVCDWVGKDGDWDLVKCIVNVNSRLLLRQRGRGWK